jgi:predicted signal transduction protein with EAL and GGDEF domain
METKTQADPIVTFAFQPIVGIGSRSVLSYEALIRGAENEPAYQVLKQVPPERMHLFDQQARASAIALATRLKIDCNLNLNFLPLSLYSSPEAITSTLEAATQNCMPLDRLVLEVVEGEVIADQARFAKLINRYRGLGVKVAIDDFGAGYAGLSLLANFQPDQIKSIWDLSEVSTGRALAKPSCVRSFKVALISESMSSPKEWRRWTSMGGWPTQECSYFRDIYLRGRHSNRFPQSITLQTACLVVVGRTPRSRRATKRSSETKSVGENAKTIGELKQARRAESFCRIYVRAEEPA